MDMFCSPSVVVRDDYGEAYLRHEIWAVRDKLLCGRCGLSWKSAQGDTQRIPLRCSGAAAGRAATSATGNINFLWSVYVHHRPSLLQQGARLVVAAPVPRWAVDPRTLREAARDQAHFEELVRLLRGSSTAEQDHRPPPWSAAPEWLPSYLHQPWETDTSAALLKEVGCIRADVGTRLKGHRVAFVGPLAYCTRCACFARLRMGSRFKGNCREPTGRAAAAAASRLRRLRSGKHPIAGIPLHLDNG